jgi:hypothetical protein
MGRIDQVHWLATENIARFRGLLASCTDELRRQQLEELLARELERLMEHSRDESAGELADIGTNQTSALPASPSKPPT